MQSFPRVAYDVICHVTLTSTTKNYGHVTLATAFLKTLKINQSYPDVGVTLRLHYFLGSVYCSVPVSDIKSGAPAAY